MSSILFVQAQRMKVPRQFASSRFEHGSSIDETLTNSRANRAGVQPKIVKLPEILGFQVV
jgi:hypothetical protein